MSLLASYRDFSALVMYVSSLHRLYREPILNIVQPKNVTKLDGDYNNDDYGDD